MMLGSLTPENALSSFSAMASHRDPQNNITKWILAVDLQGLPVATASIK
jgi:hypothetical protein